MQEETHYALCIHPNCNSVVEKKGHTNHEKFLIDDF